MAGALGKGVDVIKKRIAGKEQAKRVSKHREFLRARSQAAKKPRKLGLKQKAARIGTTTRSTKEIMGALDWDKSKLE